MAHDVRRIGRFEIVAVIDADFPGRPITEAFPGIPADELLAAKNAFPGVYTDDDRWRLWIRAWVVRYDGGCLLFDTGIGGPASPTRSWVPRPGELVSEIGVATGDVDTVAISHVHDDHIGGLLTDAGDPLFPEARHVIQRADLEWQRLAAVDDPEEAAIWALLGAVEDAKAIDAIDGDHQLAAGLTLRHVPGHTPGHQILIVEDAGLRMMLSADTWNHPVQLVNPDWPSGADADHAAAAAARRIVLADLDSQPGTIVAPTHLAESFGEVRRSGDGWTWVAV
jgi:glyoxylase-like metal-dependent hydrolase (beta-lactamase superfamily II)